MYPYVASDGHPDICISEADMALIVALVNSADELLDKAKYAEHYHAAADFGGDQCRHCGHDIRHSIHIRQAND